MYQLQCPLGHTLEIGPEHFGQRLMCPTCQAVVHASPPRLGEAPAAKYEVQCAQGHILRVKQKYLGKEIRCPSCQQLVSMKATMLLTSDGQTLGTAKPEAFKKKKSKSSAQPDSHQPARKQKKAGPPAGKTEPVRTSRIPPPPQAGPENDTDDNKPMPPEVVDDDEEVNESLQAKMIAPSTVQDDDFEFEVVDTQFNMEIHALGLESKTPTAPVGSKGTGRTTPPPSVQTPAPRRQKFPVQEKVTEPASSVPSAPTGLHGLSGSELIKVQYAALIGNAESPQAHSSALLQFHCPNGHLLEVEAQHRGAQIQCPTCMAIFVLPNA